MSHALSAPEPRVSPVSIIEDAAGSVASAAKALRKHWPTIVACVVLAGGAALVYSKATPRVYEATSTLEITPKATQPLGDKDNAGLDLGVGSYWDTREYSETQYKILTSDRVLRTVVRDLGLRSDPDFLGLKAPPTAPFPESDVIDVLRGHLMVEPIKNTRLFALKVDDTNAVRAQHICDAVASAFIDQNLQNAISATSDAVVWLNGQVDHIKQELDQSENALHTFKRDNDLPSTSINEASNMLRLELQEFDEALTHTRTRRQELLARHAELASVLENNPAELPASELLSNAFLTQLRTQYLDAVREHDALLAEGKGENHPLVRRANERVTEVRAALIGEVRNIKGAVERDLAVVNREEIGESTLFEGARRKAVDLNMKEIEYHRLDRARERNEKLFELLLARMKEADIARMMKVNNIRVVDVAKEPKSPVRPRTLINVGIGLLVGLVFGIALSLGREQLDNSLKTPDDLEQKLGITFLGLLPELEENTDNNRQNKRRRRVQQRKLASELIVHEQPLSGIAEAARSIRTNLMFMNPDRPYRKLLVTSAAPSEGKTTIACSIAIALAQGGQRVCIVDGDLRRPRLHRIFDRAGDLGVTSVIVGSATIDDVAKPTIVDNLWSVPAGPIPPNPADLLHSERFKRFLNELAERFDRVVIDSPPIVPVTDSAIISTLVDGTVFVVRAFKTTRNLTRQGLRALRDVDSPLIGAVLNAVNLNRREYSYYYHYYYYRRDGYRYAPLGGEKAERDADRGASPPPN